MRAVPMRVALLAIAVVLPVLAGCAWLPPSTRSEEWWPHNKIVNVAEPPAEDLMLVCRVLWEIRTELRADPEIDPVLRDEIEDYLYKISHLDWLCHDPEAEEAIERALRDAFNKARATPKDWPGCRDDLDTVFRQADQLVSVTHPPDP